MDAPRRAEVGALTIDGRYDRMSSDYTTLTGATPTSMFDFVTAHAGEFTRSTVTG